MLVGFLLETDFAQVQKTSACSTCMIASMMNIILSRQFFYELCVDTVNFTLIITKLRRDQQTPTSVQEPNDWERVQNSFILLIDRAAFFPFF